MKTRVQVVLATFMLAYVGIDIYRTHHRDVESSRRNRETIQLVGRMSELALDVRVLGSRVDELRGKRTSAAAEMERGRRFRMEEQRRIRQAQEALSRN